MLVPLLFNNIVIFSVTVGARGIGRGALLEQLTELGVKPAPKGRGILSTDWGKHFYGLFIYFFIFLFSFTSLSRLFQII